MNVTAIKSIPSAHLKITTYVRKPSKSESREDHEHIVFRQDQYRVIVCRDHIQWIIQKRYDGGLHGWAWRAKSYHTCKDSLKRKLCKLISPHIAHKLDHLPDKISQWAPKGCSK